MSYEEVLQYLYSSLPMYQRVGQEAIKKDLTNTFALCSYLDNPHLKFNAIHIAGTNGKGSSAHSIAAILQTTGYKTGLYTSPHLKEFTERIKINGVEIPKEEVVSFVVKNKPALEDIKPSFFEMTVAMAFDYFASEQVDVAVIETGLGGRLDSTNIITPLVSLITNIGYDHMDMLGDTLVQIAFEKGGIIKDGIPAVIGEKHEETTPVFASLAASKNAPLYFAQDDYRAEVVNMEGGKSKVHIYKKGEKIIDNLLLALGGIYQVKNLPGILKTLELLNDLGYPTDIGQVAEGLRKVHELTGLKGRWQVLDTQPLTICDTGHNQEAFRDIVAQLSSIHYTRLHMVLGFSADKDIDKLLDLLPRDASYYFCHAQVPRAMASTTLKNKAQARGLQGEAYASVEEAFQNAYQSANFDDLIFIGGSTFIVAEIKML